jgi:hypothetical protein
MLWWLALLWPRPRVPSDTQMPHQGPILRSLFKIELLLFFPFALCIGITPTTVDAFRINCHLRDPKLRTRSNPREQSTCMWTASGTTAMPSSINGRQNKVYLDPFLRYDEYLNHSKTIESCSYFVFALNQHKYLTTESRTSLSAIIATQLQLGLGHSPTPLKWESK